MKEKKQPLKCHFCANHATHVIMVELREKPGPPLKENNVLRVACDIHSIDTTFDNWVPVWAFKGLCSEWKNVGVILNKAYCSINIIKFK